MIRVLVIVVALIVAVMLGLGGLVHFNVIPDITGGLIKPVDQKAETAPPPGPPPRVDPVFLGMAPFSVPIIQNKTVSSNIYFALRLELAPGTESAVAKFLPQLHDLYLRALFQMVPEMMERRTTPDFRAIKDRLKVITERVVGTGQVKEIIIMSAFIR
ncbi:hypothetical protein [Novispirillum itersonii]|uniref:Flagellar basal body-associated protein FliL n=1 Tax=Novispirillum itersonii TaxID=189 RepID=A0A7X0DLI7_NOVIT|nr:hypothetical protein [Novispirillum itersonii]MBB6210063.1 flagellar basal body-associated protein FliL [Novispirillum itersonii]